MELSQGLSLERFVPWTLKLSCEYGEISGALFFTFFRETVMV